MGVAGWRRGYLSLRSKCGGSYWKVSVSSSRACFRSAFLPASSVVLLPSPNVCFQPQHLLPSPNVCCQAFFFYLCLACWHSSLSLSSISVRVPPASAVNHPNTMHQSTKQKQNAISVPQKLTTRTSSRAAGVNASRWRARAWPKSASSVSVRTSISPTNA